MEKWKIKQQCEVKQVTNLETIYEKWKVCLEKKEKKLEETIGKLIYERENVKVINLDRGDLKKKI